jgi:hypothetical protein
LFLIYIILTLINGFISRSTIFDEEAENALPQFKKWVRPSSVDLSLCLLARFLSNINWTQFVPTSHHLELKNGKVLGRSGFCIVTEILKFDLEPNSPLDKHTNSVGGLLGEEGDELGKLRYDGVVIQIVPLWTADVCARASVQGMQSRLLARSALMIRRGMWGEWLICRFLSVICHPNIIKMRAISDGNMYDRGFFVVLDRLYEPLTLKIVDWKKKEAKASGIGKLMDMKGKKKKKVFTERLLCVYDLSTALEYLHSFRTFSNPKKSVKGENLTALEFAVKMRDEEQLHGLAKQDKKSLNRVIQCLSEGWKVGKSADDFFLSASTILLTFKSK